MKKSEVIKEGELEGMKRAYELIAEKLEPVDTTTDELGKKLLTVLKLRNPRGAWDRGVKDYAEELASNLVDMQWEDNSINSWNDVYRFLLNGAKDWKQFSEGGSSLVSDYEIAKRVCSPSELKKTHEGNRKPNANEDWIDVQARALHQAAMLIKSICYDTLGFH